MEISAKKFEKVRQNCSVWTIIMKTPYEVLLMVKDAEVNVDG